MNDGHSNGIRIQPVHHIISSLNAVFQYDHKSSESGSGKMGTLCICQLGISLILSESEESNVCHHKISETSFFTPLPNVKNIYLFIEGKMNDFADIVMFDDLLTDKLILHCKDFREIILHLPKKDDTVPSFLKYLWQKAYQNIESPCPDLCARSSTSSISSFLDQNSWEKELLRLNVNSRKPKWKVIENKAFKSCEIIGQFAVVPNSISVENVSETGRNHTKNRFMSWCWTDSETMVSLLRCSEPQTILNNSYLNKILSTVNSGRAKTHAVLSTARLKDSCPSEEMISNSFEKLWNACLVKDSEYFFKNLESSKWLHHIQSLVRASRHIARTLKCDKNPVVVIDESGRDISCLVVSLVLVLCDRYYRTIIGFANLINKEWVSAGYAFRSSLMSVNGVDSNFLPTFVMFLDCVHTVILQYPTEFEFTELYLIEIVDKVFSGDSELFMFNCPKDISLVCKGKENDVVDHFWQKVLNHKSRYSNPLFDLKDKILNSPQQPVAFDERTHLARTSSYSYAVSKEFEGSNDNLKPIKRERRGTLMLKAIKKPNLHLFHRNRKKSKMKKEKVGKVGASSFFSAESESPRERLTSIKNIFKSKFDPINVNYCMINMVPWDRYFFRHSKNLDNCLDESEQLLCNFVHDITLSCSDFVTAHCSDESSDHEPGNDVVRVSFSEFEPLDSPDDIQRSDSVTTINSDRMERSIHVSEIDLCNDHVDKDYESAEELSLNGLNMECSLELQAPVSEVEKRLSHVMEEPEMSNTKSPQTVVLEIAEATNDVQDF